MKYFKNFLYEWRMRQDPDCRRAFMLRFWNTLLLFGTVVVAFSMAFVLWSVFVPLSITPLEGGEARDAAETISRERLREVLSVFEQRELNHQKLRATPPRVSDPSK